jgi:Protein of unknwon function (DUF3310)
MSYVAQVGGTHYGTGYGHWDLVADMDLDYFIGNATKYLCRFHKKNGIQDLEKALSYLVKGKAVGIPLSSSVPSSDEPWACAVRLMNEVEVSHRDLHLAAMVREILQDLLWAAHGNSEANLNLAFARNVTRFTLTTNISRVDDIISYLKKGVEKADEVSAGATPEYVNQDR